MTLVVRRGVQCAAGKPPLQGQAASDRALSGLRFQGSDWSIRLLGCSGTCNAVVSETRAPVS